MNAFTDNLPRVYTGFNPNHSNILQGALFLEKYSTVGNWYFQSFTSSNGAKLLRVLGKKYRP